jgi:hypothetical protein
MLHPSSGVVPPSVRPVPIRERPPDAEPRQVSIPAAVRPGATTVGGVMSLVVEVVWAGLLISTAEFAPDVVASGRRPATLSPTEQQVTSLYACDTSTHTVDNCPRMVVAGYILDTSKLSKGISTIEWISLDIYTVTCSTPREALAASVHAPRCAIRVERIDWTSPGRDNTCLLCGCRRKPVLRNRADLDALEGKAWVQVLGHISVIL